MSEPFSMPRPDQRTLILGSTGSGKTTLAVWLLSEADFDIMPWVIVDYKRDDLIGSIQGKRTITLNEVPSEPGIYHLRPNPVSDDDAMESWLYRVWSAGAVGLYVDEALRLPAKKTGAFESILTQGRSLMIPVISLSQRPVDLTRYAFSEANHVVMFRLTDKRDQKRVGEYIPIDEFPRLRKFHSLWYNVDGHQTYAMSPVPSKADILATFKRKLRGLGPQRRAL
jgi:DNA helicase HerA-like ATPase